MELSQFKAVAKPRNAWQAIDLGIVMARPSYWLMFFSWLIPASIFYSIFVFFFWDIPWLAITLTWWLKPIWERAPLYIISREIFAESVTLRQVWRNYWSIIKTDLLWWATLRRLTLMRSFNMPVTLLERLKGKQRSDRLNILHRRLSNGATWLLIAGFHIEGIILFGLIAALFMLVPQGVELNFSEWFATQHLLISHAYNSLYVLVMALIAPFYVCGGFSLYLQRRVDLEGWDIEIRFRDLVERRKQKRKKIVFVSIALFALCIAGSSLPKHAIADPLLQDDVLIPDDTPFENTTLEPTTNYNVDPQQRTKLEIRDILLGEDFHNIKTEESWQLKGLDNNNEDEEESAFPEWMINFAEWMENNGGFLSGLGEFFRTTAKLLELMLWIVVISLVLFLIFHFRHLLAKVWQERGGDEKIEIEPPKVLFGLDVTQESLPDDVVASAQAAWQQGNQRQALGILLRSSIIKLLHDHQYPFNEGNTEQECAKIVEKKGNKHISQYFWPLTRTWQAIAYAHKDCSEESFVNLCQHWNEVFTHE